MSEFPAPLALTMGDPSGVGLEITIGAWRALRESGGVFFVLDNPARYERLGASVAIIKEPLQAGAVFADAIPVLPLKSDVVALPGDAQSQSPGAVLESIERAVRFAGENRAGGVVTNPIHKASLMRAGFQFPGHTEFLAALTHDIPMAGERRRGAVMMIASAALRAVPITIHMAVKDAIAALTPDLIVETALVVDDALQFDFAIAKPRLAISGLNPHAGEDGALGMEDVMIISPAIDSLKALGIDARGPLPADTLFHEQARTQYDAALCMLHDQALIPAKTLAFHDGVNVTLGLPIVRTSPDHGCAFDIAGKNAARPDSLIAAIKLAHTLAKNRQSQR